MGNNNDKTVSWGDLDLSDESEGSSEIDDRSQKEKEMKSARESLEREGVTTNEPEYPEQTEKHRREDPLNINEDLDDSETGSNNANREGGDQGSGTSGSSDRNNGNKINPTDINTSDISFDTFEQEVGSSDVVEDGHPVFEGQQKSDGDTSSEPERGNPSASANERSSTDTQQQLGSSSEPASDSSSSNQTGTESLHTDWEETARRTYNKPETDLELLKQVDAYLDRIDSGINFERERERAGEHYRVHDRLKNKTTTQSTLGFDYVRDDGIIVNKSTGEYWALLKVEPIRWMTEDKDGKKRILAAYITFLRSLQWGVSIPCYPKSFDLSTYLSAIHEAGARENAQERNPVLDYGRRYHISWVSSKVDSDDIKRKEHYVITKTTEDQAKQIAMPGESSLFSTVIRDTENLLSFGDDEGVDDAEQKCIEELRQRQGYMRKQLTRTGVEIDVVDDRKETLEVAYYYFNHIEPLVDEFDFGTVPKADFSQL